MTEWEELENRFRFHPADTPEKGAALDKVRALCWELVAELGNTVPDGREWKLMITKMEEVMFWACAGIARRKIGDSGGYSVMD